ncbi:MAG: hypothetical protein ACI3XR_02305 [Eubacteriales bacterium]
MNKRITSLLLCFVMIVCILATAVPALALSTEDPITVTIDPDKTTVSPGDTVTYTVNIGPVKRLQSVNFTLIIPDGLTYVSGKEVDGLQALLGADKAEYTDSTKTMIIGGGGSYNCDGTTAIMTFSCVVNEGTAGKTLKIEFEDDYDFSDDDYETYVTTIDTDSSAITVAAPHVHVYDQETLDFPVSEATCTSPAVYHKSCACGAEGTETFTYGSALGHEYTKKVETEAYLKTAASNCTEYNEYWFVCSRCDACAKDDAAASDKYFTSTTAGNHSFTEKIEDAAHYVAGTGTDCQSVKKYYYDCAYCDLIGTSTWDSTTYGPHSYSSEWSSDESGHWHECTICHDKADFAPHTPGAEATETTPQTCTECGYVITPALGHTHKMTKVEAKAPTCTEDGNVEYYVCDGCDKLFKDSEGNEEITAEETVVAADGHQYEWVIDKEATETEAGSKHEECKVCGDKKDAVEIPALGHTHKMTKVEAKAPTCTEDGNVEYYKCDGCGKLFEDAEGKVEITAEDTVVKASGHEYEWVIDKEATETEAGSKHEECKVCGDKKDPVEIPATGTDEPDIPQPPQTGDNSMLLLSIALIVAVGAGVTGTAIYSRKRKSSAK